LCVVSVALGRWSVEEPSDNPLQNDLGLVLKVIVTLYHSKVLCACSTNEESHVKFSVSRS